MPAQETFDKPWDQVRQAISSRYYARKSKKEVMDRLISRYEPLAKSARSRAEFSDVVNRMIDEFGDSHFDFFTPSDQGYYLMDALAGGKERIPQFGAWFKRTVEGYTVQMVLEGTPAQKAGLMKGSVVTLLDGRPFSPVESLRDVVGKTATITFRKGLEEISKPVEVSSTPALEMFLEATRSSVRTIEKNGKKFGYVHLWTMANIQFRDTLANIVYGELRDTDGIILDIRDGFGGRPEGYGDPFFRPEVDLGWKSGDMTIPQKFGYGKPVALLINGGSRSAKEVFSYIMKKSRRATLIGSTTSGAVLGTAPGRLNDWSFLEIPMVEVFVDGKTLEGKGVSPDISLPAEFDAKGEDLYIKRAVEFLLSRAR